MVWNIGRAGTSLRHGRSQRGLRAWICTKLGPAGMARQDESLSMACLGLLVPRNHRIPKSPPKSKDRMYTGTSHVFHGKTVQSYPAASLAKGSLSNDASARHLLRFASRKIVTARAHLETKHAAGPHDAAKLLPPRDCCRGCSNCVNSIGGPGGPERQDTRRRGQLRPKSSAQGTARCETRSPGAGSDEHKPHGAPRRISQ